MPVARREVAGRGWRGLTLDDAPCLTAADRASHERRYGTVLVPPSPPLDLWQRAPVKEAAGCFPAGAAAAPASTLAGGADTTAARTKPSALAAAPSHACHAHDVPLQRRWRWSAAAAANVSTEQPPKQARLPLATPPPPSRHCKSRRGRGSTGGTPHRWALPAATGCS